MPTPLPLPYALSGAAYQRGARRRGNAERHRPDANQRPGRRLRLDPPWPPRRRAGPGRPGRQAGPLEGRHAGRAGRQSHQGRQAGRGHGRHAARAASFRQGDPQAGVGSAAEAGHAGGWRGTTGWLPMAPAATVTFRVPQPQTEVRLGQASPTAAASSKPSGPTKPSRRPWDRAGPCNCSGVRKWPRPKSIAA